MTAVWLGGVPSRRVLARAVTITRSDGKLGDYDEYIGEFGIDDTRQALIEAKRLGIYRFYITLDSEARLLPHLYGAIITRHR